jgi:hypothetical protein
MFVDTDLLRMGADFSSSAGTIVQSGASEFESTQLSAGIFGDFDAAEGFYRALNSAHQAYSNTMAGHHVALEGLAQKAHVAATAFQAQDVQSAQDVAAENMPL